MVNRSRDSNRSSEKDQTPSLKGTFISVILVGLFIVICWAVVYAIFSMR